MSIKRSPAASFARALERHLGQQTPNRKPDLDGDGEHSLAAWFLGPKGENASLFQELVTCAIDSHARDRSSIYKTDPPWITEEIKTSPAYRETASNLKTQYDQLLSKLEGSVPFFSYRYQAHMLWDIAMPGMLGYFAGMLYNQNNVAAEASPVTTPLEIQVGYDLCRMLGFSVSDDENAIQPWGHITCDGSVANTEAMWAARNLKYYPVALAAALKAEKALAPARNIHVILPDGSQQEFRTLTPWQLLNLDADVILSLPARLQDGYGISNDQLTAILAKYTIQDLGFTEFERKYLKNIASPVIIGPATMHYSWPKAAALLGLGRENLKLMHLDLDARMEIASLKKQLEECLKQQRPVIMVVSVLGSTEESAVDPLDQILELRETFRKQGLDFPIHVDGAWGGYFASLLRKSESAPPPASKADTKHTRQFTPEMVMSAYVQQQYEVLGQVDSITIDPHKSGYQPYPAGGLCYRNSAMRNIVSFTAPVVYHGGVDPTVGVYGIEGSKPGAAAAGVYLNHRVIPTDNTGYGKILGKCNFNSKRFYAELVTMTNEDDNFIVVPLQRIPAERENKSPRAINNQLKFIRERIAPRTNDELLADAEAMKLFRELGPDLVITTYAFNFKTKNGLNRDVDMMNKLNNTIYDKLRISVDHDRVRSAPIILTSSSFDPTACGSTFIEHYMKRLGVVGDPATTSISFLLSTTMNPWLTDTEEGNYIPTLIAALRKVVMQTIQEITG